MTEIKITRRVALDKPYEYYELEATYDPAEVKGNKAIKDIEKQVVFIRTLTAADTLKDIKKVLSPEIKKALKKAAKIPTKKPAPESSEDIKISELQAGDKVNINVKLLKVGDSKAFISKTDGSPGVFCKCDIEDDSGQMKLTLFGDQVALVRNVKRNAWLKIENGYVKEYKGVLELSVGQYGKMEVVYNG